ncbi:MAG: electron transporter RnfG [Bacteroidetes bacterium]|nr:MAG: electron transporter RnfG [Bacteroidota bacterium]PTM14018.1 MAG: electron transporter RnfG [Bacteroidota bacterium]
MSATQQRTAESSANTRKMLQAMVGLGISCALLIVLTYEGTLPRIEQNKAAALEAAVFQVLPGIVTMTPFVVDENGDFRPATAADAPADRVYAGYDGQQQCVGVAVTASGQGYADIIRVLYGYAPHREQLVGFYVLESKETPGLGDKIEKDPGFQENFHALDVSLDPAHQALKQAVVTVKQGAKKKPWQIDGITGATISSRAIGNIIGASTQRWIPLIYQQQARFAAPKPSAHE